MPDTGAESGADGMRTYECDGCGRRTELETNASGFDCGFCGGTWREVDQ